jgi:RecT family
MSNIATVKSTFSLTPSNLKEAMEYAGIIANSTIVPKGYQGKAGDILVAVQMGAELGLKPIQALQNIAVINGKPSVYGDALLALVQAHPSFEDVQEAFDEKTNTATCTVKRKNQSEYTVSFSAEDARKAGLWGKVGPWTQYPKRMLQMRARGFALRDKFADALSGLIMAEEAQDYSSISDVTPKTQTLSSKLDNLIVKQDQAVNESVIVIEEQNTEKLQELSTLVLRHNISDEIIGKWCNKAGVSSIDELDNSKIESCINYINLQYSYSDKIEEVA